MTALSTMLADLVAGRIEVVDLTAPLSERTPIMQLPPPFANTQGFSLQEISRYDERGPAWYWNNISAGEHVGTHFDAPVHWVSGKDGVDVAAGTGDAVDRPGRRRRQERRVRREPGLSAGDRAPGGVAAASMARCRPAAGCCIRTGWDARADDQAAFINANETGPHTPGISVACARWLAEQAPIIGVGVETVGTDAGTAHSFDPPFPCHSFLLGAGKYGLTQLANLAKLPPTGAVLIAAPLPIVRRVRQPGPVLALVQR